MYHHKAPTSQQRPNTTSHSVMNFRCFRF